MGGGLMQLVAYGAQDIYLTGNPQITFFKVVYRRHTNFAVEAIEQVFNGTPAVGGKAVVPITRNGDLVTKMYLHTTAVSSSGSETTNVGFQLISACELQIGGTKIDKIYGRWMHIWSELTTTTDLATALGQLVDAVDSESTELFVPLTFFCCRNDGLALPLIALQYHDVRLEFEFGSPTGITMSNTTLLVDYIYLDSEERKRFAQASHEYLIEQLQFTGVESSSVGANKYRLNFNHPVKELVFAQAGATFGDYSTSVGITKALLQLNGHDRFSEQNAKYFNYVQPYQHHTATPAAGICVYSFALKPEEHQPSGTCNFSRIDNATLTLTTTGATNVFIYAVNYNVLRVMSGMGGVAYSN
jgi:hypothetical protein